MRIRSSYSFKTAVGHLPDVFSRVQEVGYPVAPLSDRASTFGFVRWKKLCDAAGVEPFFGVELAVVPRLGEAKPTIDYWTFFATDTLQELHELFALATSQCVGREKTPALLYEQALAPLGLIKITGERVQLDCFSNDDLDDNFFFGLSPSVSKGLCKLAMDRELRPIALSDNLYPREEDREFYRVALGGQRGSGTQSYEQHILDDAAWRRSVEYIAPEAYSDAALANRVACLSAAANGQRAVLEKAKLFVPDWEDFTAC